MWRVSAVTGLRRRQRGPSGGLGAVQGPVHRALERFLLSSLASPVITAAILFPAPRSLTGPVVCRFCWRIDRAGPRDPAPPRLVKGATLAFV